jgi:Predicted phage phi-C31 gp36 major capsid-like protein
MKTQEELLNIISTNTALISKAFEEAGDELSYDKITSLTGTPKEKADALQSLINERDSAKTEYDAMEVEKLAMVEEKKKNAEIAKAIVTPVNRKSLITGLNDKTFAADEDYTKSFAIPRGHVGTGSVQYCKNNKEAYAVGMWVISEFTSEKSDVNRRAKQFVNDNLTFKALAGQNNATGGALVPQEFLATLIDLREKYGVYQKYARKVPMTSDTLMVPRRNTHTAAYWVTENNPPTTSAPTFNDVQLITKKLASEIAIPFELVEDSAIDIGEWVMQDFAWNFGKAIDLAAFTGDGTGTYGNIVGYTNKLKNLSATYADSSGLVVATGTGYGTNYNSIVLTDFEAVQGRLLTDAWDDAKWFMSSFVYNNVAKKLALAAGGVTGSEVVNGVNVFRFLGCEVVITQVMPSVSAVNQVCALFGSIPLSSKMGDRRAFQVKTSDQAGSLWTNDQLGIKATQRLDINVHDVGNNNSDATLWEMSPMVGLITASS